MNFSSTTPCGRTTCAIVPSASARSFCRQRSRTCCLPARPSRGSLLKVTFSTCRPRLKNPIALRAVFQVLQIDVDGPQRRHARGLLAQRVLVQGQHLVVGQQIERERIEPFHVAADQQRRGEQAPQADVRVLLVGRELRRVQRGPPAHVAHHQHVRIVPVARARHRAPSGPG